MGGSSILNINDYEYNKYDPNLNLDTNNLKSHYDKKYKDYKKILKIISSIKALIQKNLIIL